MASFWDLAYMLGAPWDVGQPPEELTELVEEGKLEPCRVLDIGCGTGTSVVYLGGKGFEASGLDVSRLAIEKAKRKASAHGVKCRFYKLDFGNTSALTSAGLSTFDLLLDNGCYHSLSLNGRDKYAGSLLRVSHTGTICLLWCFLSSPTWRFGPPGVDLGEVKDRFSKNFRIREERELQTSYRRMLFYVMERREEEK
jgi:SAM-dependent methyltransferase